MPRISSACEPAIGKEVNVETGLYTVIGVLDKQKQALWQRQESRRQPGLFPHGHVS
jgi:hypothetical protein